MIDQLFEFVQNHPLLVGAFVAVLAAWLAYELKTGNHGVSTSEATNLVNRDDAVIVDIRDEKEFRAGHIAGARNIPNNRLDDRLSELDKFKDKPIVVVCKQGQTAGTAVGKLTGAGFARAVKLKGGMAQWQADNLPVVKK
ncbi:MULTISPECIES: rhodanese-like domain-containing protein [Modicisalibacter]|uniref:rhodanese-like domain-containing protein n=1 Tax=Modicisalibacter TaxID=574347 RepID=UPI00100B32FB|nr:MULTISPECIES: rhodanese-like domain-containing protein [Halomonadaceae]MBZ9558722.1 rhodanese-like domain-containing protein [Modicisalibacter sp. R2A 31.J]MBZ9575386.1 rhodanese-like domain-containing protein [Modicisalibacter sp. MOD 31.J]